MRAINFHGVLHSEFDIRVRQRSRKLGAKLQGRAKEMWNDLEQKGFTIVSDWGLDINKLQSHAEEFLKSSENKITSKTSKLLVRYTV